MRSSDSAVFVCYYEACGQTFTTKFNLRRHVNAVHLDIKTYECDLCKKKFASKQNLTEHRFIHTGERPFRCFVCNRCFRQASQLCQHRKRHLPISTLAMLLAREEITYCQATQAVSLVLLPAITYQSRQDQRLPIPFGLLD